VFIYVPPGRVVEEPINVDYAVAAFNQDAPYLWYRRALVVLDRGSQATVIESFDGGVPQYATNALTEIVLGDGARLDHYKAQEEASQAFHIAITQAVLGRNSNFSTHYVGLGGALVRNEVRVRFDAENGEATVNGLYLAGDSQHIDNFTVIDHAQAHCASHELYKGILDGRAKGVFNGKIFVRLHAQKTDAKQTNQTLLLSDDATINTKPQLEIFADDVKCTHGATVGQLDAQQLFYLRSRGIDSEQARALLTFAFANDIVGRIKVPSLRDRLEMALLASRQLPRLEEIEDE
jgi:Fe-S cluster assembly protein SufD